VLLIRIIILSKWAFSFFPVHYSAGYIIIYYIITFTVMKYVGAIFHPKSREVDISRVNNDEERSRVRRLRVMANGESTV